MRGLYFRVMEARKEMKQETIAQKLKQYRLERDLSHEQIGDQIGLDHVKVNRRLSDLERDCQIEKTESRHMNRSGREAVQYRVIRNQ